MFYSDPQYFREDDILTLFVGFLVVPATFGGLHMTLWSAYFYYPLDKLLWRVCALYNTAQPSILLLGLLLMGSLKDRPSPISKSVYNLTESLCTASLAGCFFTRLILSFLCFATLSHLPEGAYYDIEWGQLLPHI
jgi:hypothetical protein